MSLCRTARRWLDGDFNTLPAWVELNLRNRVDASFKQAWPRAPLVPPGTDGKAADSYVRAAEVAIAAEVDSIYRTDEIIEGRLALGASRPDFQRLARSTEAAEIAQLLQEGASRSDGRSPLSLPSYDISLGAAGGFPVLLLQRIVCLHAISKHADGEVDQCFRILLALMRFHQDLARGTYTDALAVSLGQQVEAGRLMRRLAQERPPGAAAFRELLTGYGRLLETEVPIHQVVINENTSRVARILAAHKDISYSFPRRRLTIRDQLQSFVIMRANKEVAGMVRSAKVDKKSLQRFVRRAGGLERDLLRMDETEALWQEYATLDGRRLSDRLEFVRGGVQAICGPDGVPRGTGDSALSAEIRHTAIRATYLFLALLYARMKGGSVPSSLEELVPRIIPELPRDSISGTSFQYEAGETGFALRSAVYESDELKEPIQVELLAG